MTAKRLRSVAADEPAPRRKLTVSEAAASGSYRDLLVATRDRIARAIDSSACMPRDLAALTRRLGDIGKELAQIAAQEAEEAGGAADTPDEEWSAI